MKHNNILAFTITEMAHVVKLLKSFPMENTDQLIMRWLQNQKDLFLLNRPTGNYEWTFLAAHKATIY